MSQAFDENNAGWTREYAELKELLSDEEYSAARATVNNAFYTSPEIAMCINSALVQFGFKGGNVLEPSMGIGNFFGSMPAPMQQSKLYGVELDSISGRIAKQLYQNANISITGFENTTYPDNFFDVVMGNVPFGDYKIFDPTFRLCSSSPYYLSMLRLFHTRLFSVRDSFPSRPLYSCRIRFCG